MKSLSFKTTSISKLDIKKGWLLVDASNKSLGRFASGIIKIIMGKHKPYFSPNMNCGDHIIVINAKNIFLKGKKWGKKKYIRYTGYPGGQYFRSASEQFIKDPRVLIEKAVKGMLPKNRLGKQIYKNLHVYESSEHMHQAQNPIPFNLN